MSNGISVSKEQAKGFFGELFDFSFKTWVTLRVAGFLYGLTILGVVLTSLVLLIMSFATGEVLNILGGLILIPLATLLVILLVRLTFEGAIATVAIARNTAPRDGN